MIGYLTLILTCQLLGELVVKALALPVPGPVVGMAFLFGFLLLRGHVPEALGSTADGLLRNMSLLFVPAGTGVIMHVALLSEALVPLSIAVALSTSAAIVITALMMRLLSEGERSE